MPAVKYPATGLGYDVQVERAYIPGQGTTESEIYEGEKAAVVALEAQTIAQVKAGALQNVASVTVRESRGRATLQVEYSRLLESSETQDGGTQELYGLDVVRDIALAPYFAELTNTQVAEVVHAWNDQLDPAEQDWIEKQTQLYGHICRGQETYNETAYELRITRNVTGTRALNAAAGNPNTVVSLPSLSSALRRLVSSLPPGEWLKKPVTVTSAGKRGWSVSETYQWAPKWSIIYGGTFTGA